MITSMAVTATLGFWNLFAKQMVITQAVATESSDSNIQNPAQTVEINLPPMPTLIPSFDRQAVSSNAPGASSSSTNQPAQTFQAGTKILLGGARPPLQTSAPAPITTTRSSR